eukprot:3080905-Rhodomonas_salina.4
MVVHVTQEGVGRARGRAREGGGQPVRELRQEGREHRALWRHEARSRPPVGGVKSQISELVESQVLEF